MARPRPEAGPVSARVPRGAAEVPAPTAASAGSSVVGPAHAAAPEARKSGLYLYGVVRGVGLQGTSPFRGLRDDIVYVRHRAVVALARSAPFDPPSLDEADVVAHQRVIERAMRRASVLPAPPGVVFGGRRPLVRFLSEQYPVLEEALAFIDGHWELRLHLVPTVSDADTAELSRLAMHIYAELRRWARAAVPFPGGEGGRFSAAFLVDRASWVEFVERAEDLGAAAQAFALDVTGPWPPYDFVRIVV